MNLDNVLTAADATRIQADGENIFATIGKAATLGTASAITSGAVSLLNTGIWYKNKLFGGETEELKVADILDKASDSLGDYYRDRSEVLDTAGLIVGSVVPGGLAIKGLNLYRNGQAAGSFGRNILGFTAKKQREALEKGLTQLAEEGTSIYSTLRRNQLATLAWGTADNTLQSLAYEVATVATMHRSTTFNDESFGDIAWDVVKSAGVGGVIGGGVETLFARKILRDATKAIDSKLRQVDVIADFSKRGLATGDETFSVLSSISALPKEVLENPAKLEFKYNFNGKDSVLDLKLNKLLDTKAQQTFNRGLEKVQGTLSYIQKSDPSVGTPFAAAMVDIVKRGRSEGASIEQVQQKLGDHLWGLKTIDGVASSDPNFTSEVFYFADAVADSTQALAQSITTVRPSKTAQAYRLVGDWTEMKFGTLGIANIPGDMKTAWDTGLDAVFDPVAKKIQINPQSEILRPITPKAEDSIVRLVYHPRTQTTSDSAVPGIADMATSQIPLKPTSSGVQAGNYTFSFRTDAFTAPKNSIEASARNLWANGVTNLKKTTVAWDDFALLDRIKFAPEIADETTLIKLQDGSKIPLTDLTYYEGWLLERKLDKLQEWYDPKNKGMKLDHRDVAYRLNVEPQMIEKMVASNFEVAPLRESMEEAFRPLESYAARDNLILGYDKAAMEAGSGGFIDGMKGFQDRVKIAKEKSDVAFAAIIPEEYRGSYPDAAVSGKQADVTGAGPSAFGSSNADYTDPLRAKFQALGQWVSETGQKVVNEKLTAIQPLAAKLVGSRNVQLGAILTKARRSGEDLYLDGNRIVDYASWAKYQEEGMKAAKAGEAAPSFTPKLVIDLDEDVAGFLSEYQRGHQDWFSKKALMAETQGTPWHPKADALYLPPIDTRNVPFFAFVREAEGKAFSSDQVSMVTAKTAEELQGLIAQVEKNFPGLEVVTKDASERYFKAKGQFDFQSGLNRPDIDSFLRKQGKLGDFLPAMEPQVVVEEFVRFIRNREVGLLRDTVSMREAQTFAELRWLSGKYTEIQKSKFAFLGKVTGKTLVDPFGDYIRLALDVSKKNEYTFWHEANTFVDALGTRAYAAIEKTFNTAKRGEVPWEQANAELEKLGLGKPFTNAAEYIDVQASAADKSLFKIAVAKGNMLLATVGLRLDFANSLVNIISSPLMLGAEISSIRNSLRKDPQLLAAFESQLSTVIPGANGLTVPAPTKLMAQAIASFFGPNKQELFKRYLGLGAIKDINSQYHAMLDDLALTPNIVPRAWAKKVDAAVEKGASLTGSNWSENFTRFIAADSMRIMTDPLIAAGKMSQKEQDTFIRIFVNRVQGNYTASQRPIAFQGTIGAAISLFQTYQFNLYQQLFRHIENRDVKTIMFMGAMQSTLFGLNGLPLFDAINTHLVGTASINEGHHDAYSSAVRATSKDVADWAMYGTASALPIFSDKAPSLYTRGDLNPRHMTLLPTSFNDIPVLSVANRVASAVAGFASTVGAGGDVVPAFLTAMEHQGLSRPLAGLAQIAKGESTTSKGALISAHNDLISIASASRLIGAKPIDESVALQTLFRTNAYKAYDRDRIEKLGAAVKQKLRDGSATEEDFLSFAGEYASRGGRIEGYSAALGRWMKSATQSDVNTLMNSHRSVYGQRLLEVMGADRLPDFANPEE